MPPGHEEPTMPAPAFDPRTTESRIFAAASFDSEDIAVPRNVMPPSMVFKRYDSEGNVEVGAGYGMAGVQWFGSMEEFADHFWLNEDGVAAFEALHWRRYFNPTTDWL